MSGYETVVMTVAALLAATTDSGVKTIVVGTDLDNVPSLTLAPGRSLRGASQRNHPGIHPRRRRGADVRRQSSP